MNRKKGCYIIAEMSANHGGKLEIALETVRAAKRTGADAIKLQTYTAETITLDSDKEDFVIKGGTLWDNKKLYDLYKEAYLPWEWHKAIFDEAKRIGIDCFSSPFDKTAVDFLEELNCPIYKIASPEITDIPLIEYIASKGKPMIISTGIADYDDIKLAVDTCRSLGNNDITILKCTTAYPAPIEEANLIMMKRFEKDFGVKVGLSDHTMGIVLPVFSIAMGARVIEKHFISDRSIGGPDASFSLDEKEFTEMVNSVRQAEKAIGEETYELTEKQKTGKTFARSLYITEDIKAGELFTDKNVRSVRPGFGLHPKLLKEVLGQKAKTDLKAGTPLNYSVISL